MIRIIGIKIVDRIKEAGLTQEILSRHADLIATRLGFHELTNEVCSREAYIILHISGDAAKANILVSDLRQLGGIEIHEMRFDRNEQFLNFSSEEGALRFIGILVENRRPETVKTLQKILTSYGCVIRTRLGVNEEFFGEPSGLIIIELVGDEIQMDLLEKDLQKVQHIHMRKIAF
jgi:hypothetical protein